jgi:hypothetical protein
MFTFSFIANFGIYEGFHGSWPESQLPYGNSTKQIIGCAMKVHSFYGQGFSEII